MDRVHEGIKKEIRQWSKHALEIPNSEFNNLPACPYAKAAWKDDKVDVVFKETDDYSVVFDAILNWDDTKELVIVADTSFIEVEDEFHKYLDDINECISENFFEDQDFWVMGFHPYQDSNELIDDGTFEGISDTEYALIFVQRLSKLQEASDKLVGRNYYDRYFKTYDVSEMYEIRKDYYRRLKDARIKEGRPS
jgi:hypothetical protein|tara:strand:+ start:390 stop:971 length:582 start_codon:yes stop_codon:yes gene_type:complete